MKNIEYFENDIFCVILIIVHKKFNCFLIFVIFQSIQIFQNNHRYEALPNTGITIRVSLEFSFRNIMHSLLF